MSIKMGAVRMGGAVVDDNMSVGGGIKLGGTNGQFQFMSLVNGVWTAVNLPVYEGGVN